MISWIVSSPLMVENSSARVFIPSSVVVSSSFSNRLTLSWSALSNAMASIGSSSSWRWRSGADSRWPMRGAGCACAHRRWRVSRLADLPDESLEEVVQLNRRVVAQTGVDLGRLDDGARRGCEPVEQLALSEPGDRPGRLVTGRDALDRREVLFDRRRVDTRRQGREPGTV